MLSDFSVIESWLFATVLFTLATMVISRVIIKRDLSSNHPTHEPSTNALSTMLV